MFSTNTTGKSTCPHCKQEVDSAASRCPHCHGKIYRWTRGRKILAATFIGAILLGFISSIGDDDSPSTTASQVTQTPSRPLAEAQAEFKDLMETGGKAGLIHSWKFNETGNVVYVTDVWYTQSVSFKKDFLAKVAMLRQETQGYRWFEVRDAYSNEKVAEVTSFSGSLEVYK